MGTKAGDWVISLGDSSAFKAKKICLIEVMWDSRGESGVITRQAWP